MSLNYLDALDEKDVTKYAMIQRESQEEDPENALPIYIKKIQIFFHCINMQE